MSATRTPLRGSAARAPKWSSPAKQARYLLLSGHLTLPPEPEPVPQPQVEPAAEAEGKAATENNAEPAADAPKLRSGRGSK